MGRRKHLSQITPFKYIHVSGKFDLYNKPHLVNRAEDLIFQDFSLSPCIDALIITPYIIIFLS